MLYIPPITKGEFRQLFHKCTPPTGWPHTLAVANSGGPDSICLLYLLQSILTDQGKYNRLPKSLVSLHINHDLQELSSSMEEYAARASAQLGVPSHTMTVPWSDDPTSIFPPRPPPNKPIEAIARDVRFNRLFLGSHILRAPCIAFAHHADDQVETSIFRLAHGSSKIGAMGMKPVRRWGMGDRHTLTRFGAAGMSRFIVRPLLEVSKDRILATCEEYGLEYVTDPSNFQPEVTLRNYIRRILDGSSQDDPKVDAWKTDERLNPHVEQTSKIIEAIKQISGETSDDVLKSTSKELLRQAVRLIGQSVERMETQVTNFLREYLLPSPPSTLLLSSDTLHTIQDPALRIALVRRILRYVSPRPWGSPRAEVDGYSDSLNKMVRTLWKNSHQGFANLPPPAPPRPITINDHGEITLDARIIADLTFTKPKYHSFTYGSGVLWSPVAILPDGTTRFRPPEPFSNEKLGWLVRREPPWSVKKLENNKMDNTMILDMTSHIRDRTQRERVGVDVNSERSKGEGRRWVNAHRVMYDHRFFVELDLDHIPPDVSDILNKEPDAQVHVQLCEQRYSIPHVVLKRAGCEEMVLGELEWLGESKWLEEIRKKRSWKEGMPAREEEPWIRINPIRTWEAI